MKRFFKRLFVLILMLAFGYLCFYLYNETDLLRIQKIQFTEHPQMSLNVIEQYTGVREGDLFFSVHSKQMMEKLIHHPYVKRVDAYKTFPNALTLNMTYREHAFSLHYSDIILSLDSDLIVLGVMDEPLGGYTVEGFSFDNFSAGSVVNVRQLYILENIVKLIELLDKSQIKADSVIEYTDNQIVIKVEGVRGRFGNGEHIERRFNVFVNIYEALVDEGITSGTIDVSNEGLPVYRPFGE